MKSYIKYLVVFLMSLLILTNVEMPEAQARVRRAKAAKTVRAARATKTPKVARSVKTKRVKSLRAGKKKSRDVVQTKSGRKSRRGSRRYQAAVEAAPVRTVKKVTETEGTEAISKVSSDSPIEVLSTDTLAPGVLYKRMLFGSGKLKLAVHLIDADITDPLNEVTVKKAGGQIAGLQKLQSLDLQYDSLNPKNQMLACVNGNFWKAYTNYAMGPVIADGEVVEMRQHGRWTSAFFDAKNRMYIDRFKIYGRIQMPSGKYISIDEVNHRDTATNVVIYNHYGGDSIPFVAGQAVEKMLQDTIKDIIEMRDSTDADYDSLELQKAMISEKRIEKEEYHLPKVILRYLTLPAVNKNIRCVVVRIDSGCVKTDRKFCILSLGSKYAVSDYPKPGDTLVLKFETNSMAGTVFMQGVSGTPRLVRNGNPNPENQYEFSNSSRFVNGALPRTAIGTDSKRNHIYIAVVEPSSQNRLLTGASLGDIAQIMRSLGAYNAMNLDGGGSSNMVIDGESLLNPHHPESGRKISVAFGIVRDEVKRYYQSIDKKYINNNPKWDPETQKMIEETPEPPAKV